MQVTIRHLFAPLFSSGWGFCRFELETFCNRQVAFCNCINAFSAIGKGQRWQLLRLLLCASNLSGAVRWWLKKRRNTMSRKVVHWAVACHFYRQTICYKYWRSKPLFCGDLGNSFQHACTCKEWSSNYVHKRQPLRWDFFASCACTARAEVGCVLSSFFRQTITVALCLLRPGRLEAKQKQTDESTLWSESGNERKSASTDGGRVEESWQRRRAFECRSRWAWTGSVATSECSFSSQTNRSITDKTRCMF